MSIHELLAKVPADRLQVQFFHEGELDVQSTKKGTRLSFHTGSATPTQFANDSAPIGVVIWISREDWSRVVASVKCPDCKGTGYISTGSPDIKSVECPACSVATPSEDEARRADGDAHSLSGSRSPAKAASEVCGHVGCGKPKEEHRNGTLDCPVSKQITRGGTSTAWCWHPTNRFTPL